MTTAIIATATSLTAAIPALFLGVTDIASWFAIATMAVGTFIATWETVRASNSSKN
jgi:Na+-transporting NADH:ubiquinone oxidoreductase subunit NqrB